MLHTPPLTLYSPPSALTCSSVLPTLATSGCVYTMEGTVL